MTLESSLLEIIETEDGEILLRKADEEGEPLLRLKFSKEAQVFMGKSKLEISKAMIQAGIQAYNEMAEEAWEEEQDQRVVH